LNQGEAIKSTEEREARERLWQNAAAEETVKHTREKTKLARELDEKTRELNHKKNAKEEKQTGEENERASQVLHM